MILAIDDVIEILQNRINIVSLLSDLLELFITYQIVLKKERTNKENLKINNQNLKKLIKKSFKTEKKVYYYACYSMNENLLNDNILEILIQSLSLKKNNLMKIQEDINENKPKYEKLRNEKRLNNKKILIQEL